MATIFTRRHRRSRSSGDTNELFAVNHPPPVQIPPDRQLRPSPSQDLYPDLPSRDDRWLDTMSQERGHLKDPDNTKKSPWISAGSPSSHWARLQRGLRNFTSRGSRTPESTSAHVSPTEVNQKSQVNRVSQPEAHAQRASSVRPLEATSWHTRGRSVGHLSSLINKPPPILYQPFQDISSKYDVGEELGRGTSGTVHRCWDRTTGVLLALKTVSKSRLANSTDISELRSEIKSLRCLQGHPAIVQLVDVLEDEDNVYMVTELCQGGDLFSRIRLRKRFTERNAARLVCILVSAVEHCWAHGIMHRDLKPENILMASLDSDSEIRVADFGKACVLKPGEKRSDFVGTPFYLPPEVLERRYGKEADMWCVGVILFVLLCGRPPFFSREKDEIFWLIKQGVFDTETGVWETVSRDAKDLVRKMLTQDPEARIQPSQVKDHPWIVLHCHDQLRLPVASVDSVSLISFKGAPPERRVHPGCVPEDLYPADLYPVQPPVVAQKLPGSYRRVGSPDKPKSSNSSGFNWARRPAGSPGASSPVPRSDTAVEPSSVASNIVRSPRPPRGPRWLEERPGIGLRIGRSSPAFSAPLGIHGVAAGAVPSAVHDVRKEGLMQAAADLSVSELLSVLMNKLKVEKSSSSEGMADQLESLRALEDLTRRSR